MPPCVAPAWCCRITVKSLSERTDLQALAAEIVDKCKLIHPSKVHLHGSCSTLQALKAAEPRAGLPHGCQWWSTCDATACRVDSTDQVLLSRNLLVTLP